MSNVGAGGHPMADVRSRVEGAHVALVFLSPALLRDEATMTLLAQRQRQGMRVIPLLARPTHLVFHDQPERASWIERLQPLPRNLRPIVGLGVDRDAVLTEIARAVMEIVQRQEAPKNATALISNDMIHAIHTAAIQLGLARNRVSLLSGLDAAVSANLPLADNPLSQVLSDLFELRKAGAPHLASWLRSGIATTGIRSEARILKEALALLGGAAADRRW